jgi:hypothetical protein
MVNEKVISPAFSLKGYKITTWAANVGLDVFNLFWQFKEILKIVLPAVITYIETSGNLWLSGLIALIGKFVLDLIEYWIKKK